MMNKQLVMNADTGHDVYSFDPSREVDLKRALERHDDLVAKGFTPAKRDADGDLRVSRGFDPTASETLYVPRLIGG